MATTTKALKAAKIEPSEYGHMISIPVYNIDGSQKYDPVRKAPKTMTFGAAKAAAIIAHMPEIKKFAQKYSGEITPGQGKEKQVKNLGKFTKAELVSLLEAAMAAKE